MESSLSSESSIDDDLVDRLPYTPPDHDRRGHLEFLGCGSVNSKLAFLKNALPTRTSGRSARNAIRRISPSRGKDVLHSTSSDYSTIDDSDDQSDGSDESSASLGRTEEPEIHEKRTEAHPPDSIESKQVLVDGRARFCEQGVMLLDTPYNWNAYTLPIQCIHASRATSKTVSLVELKESSMRTMLANESKIEEDPCCIYFTRSTIASLFSANASDIGH